MKSYLSTIFIIPSVILLFTHVFNERIIQLAFELNQGYIQNELCIKKDTPGNSCLGSCYFKDQIEKEQERKESPEYQVHKEVFYLLEIQAHVFIANHLKSDFSLVNENYISNWSASVFHPPSTAA